MRDTSPHDRVAIRLGANLARECSMTRNKSDALHYLRPRTDDELRIGSVREAVTIRLTTSGAVLVVRAFEIHARAVHESLANKLPDAEQTALLRTLSQFGTTESPVPAR